MVQIYFSFYSVFVGFWIDLAFYSNMLKLSCKRILQKNPTKLGLLFDTHQAI